MHANKDERVLLSQLVQARKKRRKKASKFNNATNPERNKAGKQIARIPTTKECKNKQAKGIEKRK